MLAGARFPVKSKSVFGKGATAGRAVVGTALLPNPLYRMQNMETLSLRTTLFGVAPTARRGSGGSLEKTEETKAGGNAPDMPT